MAEYNANGEIILPVYLDAVIETRVALSKDLKVFLNAFESVAKRERLILSVLHEYLTALPAGHVEQLIPVLRAIGQRRATKASGRVYALEEIEAERARRNPTMKD